jgi:hypothetical protein
MPPPTEPAAAPHGPGADDVVPQRGCDGWPAPASGGGPLDLSAQRIVGSRVILEHFLIVQQEHRRRILGSRKVLRAFLGAGRAIWPLRDRPGVPRVGIRTWQPPVCLCSGWR